MAIYTVCYTETTERYADIEAPNKKAAIQTMLDMIANGILYAREEVRDTSCDVVVVQD